MYNLRVSWKNFKIWLPEMERWMKSNAQNYAGNSADQSGLILHFTQEPNQNTKDRIQMYFDATTEEGELSHKAWDDKREQCYAQARAAVPTLQWDAMIPSERKIVMGQQLSDDDKDRLIEKYLGESRYP